MVPAPLGRLSVKIVWSVAEASPPSVADLRMVMVLFQVVVAR